MSAWGYELLPVAALFGVVKCSGVVAIDEKYVLVPKNDKPASKMRLGCMCTSRWTPTPMTCCISPSTRSDKLGAQAFLLALRAQGYHPQVIVTDLRQDYGPLVTQVFPRAGHHECIFHALKDVQTYIQGVYGAHYPETHPEAEALKQAIYQIFKLKTKRTAQKRYQKVMALREQYVQEITEAAVIFDFLEHHWPPWSMASRVR